ncbi:MAG: hypothetical protein DBY27_10360 [Clostridiaceae bacterium]|nr:MAG: hypothetical protein DBY27_10360 [Clostridiaceae bacterium]
MTQYSPKIIYEMIGKSKEKRTFSQRKLFIVQTKISLWKVLQKQFGKKVRKYKKCSILLKRTYLY